MSVVSTEEIRGHFPALQRTHAGYPVGYFDGPGGTQVPTGVSDRQSVSICICGTMLIRSGRYPTSDRNRSELLHEARQIFADFLEDAVQKERLSFGNNMTTLTFPFE